MSSPSLRGLLQFGFDVKYSTLKNYYIVANNMVITPFILFSTFTILFTVFIPIIKKMPDTSPESSMDELEKSYF
jgi:hypothetical protein